MKKKNQNIKLDYYVKGNIFTSTNYDLLSLDAFDLKTTEAELNFQNFEKSFFFEFKKLDLMGL